MGTYVKQLYDKYGNLINPRTEAKAVLVDSNGTRLNTKLEEILTALGNQGISLTTAQKAALNSGITATLVAELTRLKNLNLTLSDDKISFFDSSTNTTKVYTLGSAITYSYGTPTLQLAYASDVAATGDTISPTTFVVTQTVTGSDSTSTTLTYNSVAELVAAGGSASFALVDDDEEFSISPTTGAVSITANADPSAKSAAVTATVTLNGQTSALVTSNTITMAAGEAAGDDEVVVTLGYFDGCNSSMGSMMGAGAATIGSSFTAVATPQSGYNFAGWYSTSSGTLVSASASYTFTVTANTTLYARFVADDEVISDVIDFDDLGGYTFTKSSPTIVADGTYHVYYAYLPAGYGAYISCDGTAEPDNSNSSNSMFTVGTMDAAPSEGGTVSVIISDWRLRRIRYFVPPSETGAWLVIRMKPSGIFANFTATLESVTATSDVDEDAEIGTVVHDSSTYGTYFNIDDGIYNVTYKNFTVKYLLVEANTIADVKLTGLLYAQTSGSSYKVFRMGSAVPVDEDSDSALDVPALGDAVDDYVNYPIYRSASTRNSLEVHLAFAPKNYDRYVLMQGDFESANAADDGWTSITVKKYTLDA